MLHVSTAKFVLLLILIQTKGKINFKRMIKELILSKLLYSFDPLINFLLDKSKI